MVRTAKKNKKKAPKEFELTEKQVKDNNLEAQCMKCKDAVVPVDARVFVHIRKGADSDKNVYSFRIGGIHKECGTKVARFIGKELGLKLIKK